MPEVVKLGPGDGARYARLRRRMLELAPWAFSATVEDDRALDPVELARYLARPDAAIFAVAAEDGTLQASAGLLRQTSPKFAHRATLWGVWVEPAARGAGLGGAVLAAALAFGRTLAGVQWIDLSVSVAADAARRLYERAGFTAWGREPEATEIDGRRYDEIHMTLRL